MKTPRKKYEQFFKAEIYLTRALLHLRDKEHLFMGVAEDEGNYRIYADACSLVEEAISDLMNRHTLLLMGSK